MAVSILTRPYGYVFLNTLDGQVDNVSGDLVIAKSDSSAHNLVTGDYIYIKSKVESYNGIWYVERIDNNEFYIREYSTAARVAFVREDNIDLVFNSLTLLGLGQDGSHSWNCVHLPIVYKLSNTLWPTNSADTVRTISTVTDSNGYCALTLSGDIKATGSAAALEFVKVTGATDDDLNKVWQIISYTNDTTFTIDIPYSSANDTALTSVSIQYYYNNYHVKVQIWGGLNNGHEYYAQEPYTLLATLDLIPDENNICKFSISEILKKNIEIKNNLLLDTLPNNLDAFTMFFIKYAEVHDDSDGTTLSTTTASYTSDLANFEGKAVNAKLAFKNVYSGALSEYVSADSSQKFLGGFTRPTIFSGKYFDLSIIWDGVKDIYFMYQWYLSSALQTTTYSSFFDAFYTGVYRGSIEADCNYDRVDVTAYQAFGLAIASSWDSTSNPNFDERTSTEFKRTSGLSGIQEAILTLPIPVETTDTVIFSITVVLVTATGSVNVSLMDSANSTTLALLSNINLPVGTNIINVSLTPTAQAPKLKITSGGSVGGTMTITIPSFIKIVGPANVISETKTIDIDCNCTRSKATGYYLSWLNNLGGFDYWYFTGYADEIIDIVDSGETEENIFPEWPESFGEFSDTIKKQTFRESREQILVRSQHLTEDQVAAIKKIKTSPLVQIVNSIYDRKTVLVDTESFTSLKEGNNLHEISFTITYTDDVPSQSV